MYSCSLDQFLERLLGFARVATLMLGQSAPTARCFAFTKPRFDFSIKHSDKVQPTSDSQQCERDGW